MNSRVLTEDGKWRFLSTAITDTQLEFSLGVRLLRSEAHRKQIIKELLITISDKSDIEWLFGDAGFDGVGDIEACRMDDNEQWALHVKDSNKQSIKNDFDRLRQEFKTKPKQIGIVNNAGYDDLDPKTQLVGYANRPGDLSTIRAFYTDMPLPDRKKKQKQAIRDLNFRYNQRSKIETKYRLSKNKLNVGSDSKFPAMKLFYFNMSVLFYNLYKAVNTLPAPDTGLTFDISQRELLDLIQTAAYNGVTPSAEMDYVYGDE